MPVYPWEGIVTWSCVDRLALREKPEFKVCSGRHTAGECRKMSSGVSLNTGQGPAPSQMTAQQRRTGTVPCTTGIKRHKTLGHPPSTPILLTLPGSNLCAAGLLLSSWELLLGSLLHSLPAKVAARSVRK